MENVVLILILVAVLGGAVFAIYKAKKRGTKCIGCPHANSCGSCGRGCSQTTE